MGFTEHADLLLHVQAEQSLPAEEAKLQETTQKFGLQKNENEMVLQVQHCNVASAATFGLASIALPLPSCRAI